MGRVVTPKYRFEPMMVFAGRFRMTNSAWEPKYQGKPTEANIRKHVLHFNEALEPRGTNEHLGRGYALYGGIIVNQFTNSVVATWADRSIIQDYKNKPMFDVVASKRVARELKQIASLVSNL